MFAVHETGIAILFCVITMLGWGSWANTQKLSGKDRWPFELFYWDFAIGVLVFSFIFAFTLGSSGRAGVPFLENLRAIERGPATRAAASGVLFNLSNILLVVAIDAAGMGMELGSIRRGRARVRERRFPGPRRGFAYGSRR